MSHNRTTLAAAALVAVAALTVPACAEDAKKPASAADAQEATHVVTTASGLKYEDLKVGDGQEAKPGNTVGMRYTGTFLDGKIFDSNDKPGGQPYMFKIGEHRVIKGWEEGIPGMKVGGKRKLTVPPELAYGAQGFPGFIPPNSTLNFQVELLSVR